MRETFNYKKVQEMAVKLVIESGNDGVYLMELVRMLVDKTNGEVPKETIKVYVGLLVKNFPNEVWKPDRGFLMGIQFKPLPKGQRQKRQIFTGKAKGPPPGKCFGTFDEKSGACKSCKIAEFCQPKTVKKMMPIVSSVSQEADHYAQSKIVSKEGSPIYHLKSKSRGKPRQFVVHEGKFVWLKELRKAVL